MSINELYDEIDNLNDKIDEETRKSMKRRLEKKDRIKKLEEERKQAGLRGDIASSKNYNFKIQQIKEETFNDAIPELKLKIKSCKKKITEIIIDYYKKGIVIGEIFKLEEIPQNIQEEWLSKSNFGKNTGYLFVDEITGSGKLNWNYINPILGTEFSSETMDDLKYQVNKADETFLGFDNELVEKSNYKDLLICQGIIDEYIKSLKNFYSFNIPSDLDDLAKYSNKFTQNQIIDVYQALSRNSNNYKYFKNFKRILVVNEDRFDSNFINNIYKNIIDQGIFNLEIPYYFNNDFYNVSNVLDSYLDKFNLDQKERYGKLIEKKENIISNQTRTSIPLEKSYNGGVDDKEIYKERIDSELDELSSLRFGYSDARRILKNLRQYADKFSNSQINWLCEISIQNSQVYNCIYCGSVLKDILDENKDKIDSRLYDEVKDKNDL